MSWVLPILFGGLLAGCGRVDFDAHAGEDAGEGAPDVGDAPDAPDAPAGSWSLIGSTGNTVYTTNDHTLQIDVAAGDLLIAACDNQASASGGTVAITVSPPDVSLTAPLTTWDPASTYVTNIAWGIVDASAGASTTLTVTYSGFASYAGNSYSDCSLSVFRGGSAAPLVVDTSTLTGGAGGLVQCTPVDTVTGGVVFYFAARTTCVDAPTAGPFMKLGATYGNTWGAWAPADGTTLGTTLSDCGNTGGWLCSMVSLAP